MPLVLTTLSNGILSFTDPNKNNMPKDINDAAKKFADAIGEYVKPIFPVLTAPDAIINAAKSSFISTFITIQNNPPTGMIQLPLAFTNFALALIPGMLPEFAGIPPPAPIDFSPMSSSDNASVCANNFATIVDLWFKTGTATNTVSGAPAVWI
jgi:hypothetical protein